MFDSKKMIAEVIINRTAKKLNRTFDYQIPIGTHWYSMIYADFVIQKKKDIFLFEKSYRIL